MDIVRYEPKRGNYNIPSKVTLIQNSDTEQQLDKLFQEIQSNFGGSSSDDSFKSESHLNLHHILPKASYFTYHVKKTFNQSNYDMIVFTPKDGLVIKSELLDSLEQLLICPDDKVYKQTKSSNDKLPIFFSEKPQNRKSRW